MRPDALVNPTPPSGSPPSEPPPLVGLGEGRIARSWRLIGRSWDLLSARPRLLVMPAVSAVAITIAALVIFLPVLWWTRHLPSKVSVVIASAAAGLPFTIISTTTNVAFLAMVDAHLGGEEPRVRQGLRVAWQRRWPILGWSLLASGVGAILDALQELPGVEWLGRIVGFIGGLTWSLATFFVVPVLAVEGLGPFASVRRSARVFRERWGETLSGELSLGAVIGLAMIPGGIALTAGVIAFDDTSWITGAILLSVGIVLLAPLLALQAALTQLFQYAVFREATTGELPPQFTQEDIGAAFTPRRRWWRGE
jgi:Family of unknown function (DUF6159)